MAELHYMEMGWSGSGWMDPLPTEYPPAPSPAPAQSPAAAPAAEPAEDRALAAAAAAGGAGKRPLRVGIGGPVGSGKTTRRINSPGVSTSGLASGTPESGTE